jgi:hypothetical protein
VTRLAVLVLAAFLAGIIVGRATSRPEAQSIPAAAIPSGASRSASWTSGLRTEAPLASATPSGHSTGGASTSPVLVEEGLASTYGPGYDGLTASRWPRGSVLRICGPSRCVTRTTNDYGPSLRFPTRIVDLDVPTFELTCGCSWYMGLEPVEVTVIHRG